MEKTNQKTSSLSSKNRKRQQTKTNTRTSKKMNEENKTTAKETEVQVKKFKPDELIPCVNAFAGGTYMVGKKTKTQYVWETIGVVTEVEYQDLRSEVLNKRSMYIYDPLIIIEDEDFLNEFPQLKTLYDNLISPDELVSIIQYGTPRQLENVVKSLPSGLKGSMRNIASTLIQEGKLDSLKKIHIIDSCLQTELAKQLDLFIE